MIYTNKMLRLGDINLNSIHWFTDPSKEMLRQTLLNQEAVFQTQVYDLHRVYRTQVNLEEELKRYQSGCYHMNGSRPSAYNLKDSAMYGGLEKMEAYTSSRGLMKQNFMEKQYQPHHEPWFRCPDIKQRRLDLNLPADEFISFSNDDFPGNDTRSNPFEASNSFKSSHHVENGCAKTERGRKKSTVIPHDVVDLEDPSFCLSSESKPLTYLSGFVAPSFTPCAKSHLGHGFTATRPFADIGPSCLKQTSFFSGFGGQNSSMPSAGFSNKKPVDLDLNIPPVESSIFSSSNSTVLNPVSGLSTLSQPVNHLYKSIAPCARTSSCDYLLETSSQQQHKEAADLNFKDDKPSRANLTREATTTSTDGNGRKIEIIDLESPSGSILECCEQKNGSLGSVGENPDNVSLDEVRMDVDASQVVNLVKKTEENVMHPSKGQMGSDSKTGNPSLSIRTLQSGLDNGDSRISMSKEIRKISLVPTMEESPLSEPDQISLESTESNDHCDDKKQDPVEVDELVQAAAETILCMSKNHVGSIKSKQLQGNATLLKYTADSYELLVLNKKESAQEDYEVTSRTVEVTEPETKCSRHKLKRGTRMRDFQKDILPSLSSLLRHEIYEDVSIMENTIRSREYKKMRSKSGEHKNTWCTSVRSRRSRTNYRRRYYA